MPTLMSTTPRSLARASFALVSGLVLAACTSSSGGPVEGPADTHCGATVQVVDPAACMATGDEPAEHEHATLFGSEGDDDDCKYHVAWSAADVVVDSAVTFTVTVTSKADGKLVTGAKPYAEIFLDATHGAPSVGLAAEEGPTGTYAIAGVRFDEAGQWTVRFHLFAECTEVDEATPHSHVAFLVDVP